MGRFCQWVFAAKECLNYCMQGVQRASGWGGQVAPDSLQGYTVCKSVIFALYLCTGEARGQS